MINTDSQKIKEDKSSSPPFATARAIEDVLKRGVEKVYPSEGELEKVLKSGRKIRLYNGIDPTGKLHLGHLAVFNKLRQFHNLGHEVIILIGDFTAAIGDPTDKLAVRQPLARKQILENAKNYKKQIGKIFDLKKSNIRFLYNRQWTNKLKPTDLLKIFSYFTVARLLERDMFQKRIQGGRDILLHEFVYPVFQAYDSVIMEVDLEVGGNDQTFNMLRGRDLMRKMKNKEKFVMALKLLTDPGGKKMGKTQGNFIALDEKPEEMFGKIMAWPDSLLKLGFELLTGLKNEQTLKFLQEPRMAKAILAKEIIKIFHGQKAADSAEKEFNRVFREKKMPSKIPTVEIPEKTLFVLDLLIRSGLSSSKAEAKRLILQKGLKIDGKIQKDWKALIQIKKGMVVQAGKKRFVKII